MFPKNPQKVSLKIPNFQKMTKMMMNFQFAFSQRIFIENASEEVRLKAEDSCFPKKIKIMIRPHFPLNSAMIEDDLRFCIFWKVAASNIQES